MFCALFYVITDFRADIRVKICTEILYQPLTLLDCLHTFCGACLKEWFLSQASRATSLHPYTCPACRASVRGTKHNATVSSLLDMYLQVNPSNGRTKDEKEEQDKIFKPGDNVLPKLRRRARERDPEEDQALNDILRISLEEAVGTSTTGQRDRDRPARSGDRQGSGGSNSTRPEGRQLGMYLHSRDEPRQRGRTSPRHSPVTSPTEVVPQRSVEHQSSLRSLLSVSEADIEEDVMRQIAEDPSLAGIDWDNITAAQSDELIERIARVYRRRQEERRRERRDRRERSSQRPPSASRQSNPQESRISLEGRPRVQNSGHLSDNPESTTRPHARQRRRAGSQPPNQSTHGLAPATLTSARLGNRHDADQTSQHDTSNSQRASQPPESRRRTTDPSVTASPRNRRTQNSTDWTTDVSQRLPIRADSDTVTTGSRSRSRISPRIQASTFPLDSRNATSGSSDHIALVNSASSNPLELSSSNRSVQETPDRKVYEEPSVTCNRCSQPDIQYEVHYCCDKCDSSGFILCQKCYRQGKGCNHWFGFGWAALAKYEKLHPLSGNPPGTELPHVLTARRYQLPEASSVESKGEGPPRTVTTEDPAERLQSGVFCDICREFSNSWYWHCSICNEGEWGFCNRCVNQGKHCTHPLLSLEYKSPVYNDMAKTATPPFMPALQLQAINANAAVSLPQFHAKTFKTTCDICKYLISPSISRYHCPECNHGDYDIHSDCYMSIVKSGRITADNGHYGWRRCPNGHRMVVLGFEDREGGRQVRIVDRDLVGGIQETDNEASASSTPAGSSMTTPPPAAQPSSQPQPSSPSWFWKDADGTVRNARHDHHVFLHGTSRVFPPDGGVGQRLVALWSYYPDSQVSDELLFPKGAEIREAWDINGDWFVGVYAGAKGLFPGNYARVIGRV